MTEQEFDKKWGKIDTDTLNDEQFKAFKDDCFEMYETTGFSDTFHSPYDENHEHNGKPFKVLRRATPEECDLEAMPLWLVTFEGEEEPYYCYPEEICKAEEKEVPIKQLALIIDLRQTLYKACVDAIIWLIRPVGGRLKTRLLYRYIDDDCEQSLLRVTEVFLKGGELWMKVAGDLGDSDAADVRFDYDEDFGETSEDNLSYGDTEKTAFDVDFIQALYAETRFCLSQFFEPSALPQALKEKEKEL